MPLNDEYSQFLAALNELDAPSIDQVDIEIARQMMRNGQPPQPDIRVGNTEDRRIRVEGGEISLRIYTPEGQGPFPLILMFHGGGWVLGDLDTADLQSRKVCLGVQAVVVSVDYRLAPEHKFPTAVNDCYAALIYAVENCDKFNAVVDKVALVGDSAGGNLAAVVSLKCRDEGGPRLRHQLLVYPVTDGTRFDTPSYRDNADGFMLTAKTMRWFWDQYTSIDDRQSELASPLIATNLDDLPPTTVMTAEYDPLRDEGEAFGKRLQQAGVPCEVIRYDGFIHGFFSHGITIPSTEKAMNDACQKLKSALA